MKPHEVPTLFELNYSDAGDCLMKLALAKTTRAMAKEGDQSWTYREGFQAYKEGKPLRAAMQATRYPETRELWRLGWLVAFFCDLDNREVVHMAERYHVLPEDM